MKSLGRIYSSLAVAIGLVFSISILSSSNVLAAALTSVPSNIPQSPTSSSGLTITPRRNAILKPGQSLTDQLVIGNLSTTQTLYVTLKPVDFTFQGQAGTPKIFLSPTAPQTAWSLKPYLTVPQYVVVPKNSSVTVNYKIKIPSYLGAGSYYSAILYQSGLGSTGNLGLSASGVTLIFVQVPGTVKESMTLQNFGAFFPDPGDETGRYVSFVTTSEPENMAFAVKNNGNVVEAPVGSIIIKKWGHAFKTIANTNPDNFLTLIGQTRLYVSCISQAPAAPNSQPSTASAVNCQKPNLSPGHYSATLTAYYGQNGNQTQEIIGTTSFWYIPMWLIYILIAILLLIIYIAYRIYRRIKNGPRTNRGYKSVSRSKSRKLPFRKK